jgi:hypothetical protein
VGLTLQGVVSKEDLQALRIQHVTGRVQQLQRDAGLVDFDAAARQLWRQLRREPPPDDTQTIVRRLAETEELTAEAARTLTARRLGVTRTYLVDSAGIPRDRLADAAGPPPTGVEGGGRVRFELRPEAS